MAGAVYNQSPVKLLILTLLFIINIILLFTTANLLPRSALYMTFSLSLR